MKYYAVIDTNVLVSALLKEGSAPWEVLQETLGGIIIPLVNDDILDEYGEVLSRAKFGFTKQAVNDLLAELSKRAVFVNPARTEDILPDPDDAVFYEVVMTVQDSSDAYLVTGNLKHFPIKPFIVTPRQMLDLIQKNKL